VLVAYQINIGKNMDKATENRCRAIYTCNLLVDTATQKTQIQGFTFGHDEHVDLNEAFACLFLEPTEGVTEIN
jgi:hypothetical protein